MADSAINITEGSGQLVDTRTESTNGNHRQVVVLGDPSTNAGVAPVDATKGLRVDLTSTGQNTTAIKVDGSAVTQPVSVSSLPSQNVTNVGTFAVQAASTQSGTWTVQPGNTANTTPWLAKISDGTNAATIKAASTAPVGTDPALVVALSPNGQQAAGALSASSSTSVVYATDTSAPVALDTSKLYNSNSTVPLTPKFKAINLSSTGTVVALVSGKKIRVLAWDACPSASCTIKWQSHVTPTDLTGPYALGGAGNGVARGFNPVGYFETVAGEALDLNISGTATVGGVLTYVEV